MITIQASQSGLNALVKGQYWTQKPLGCSMLFPLHARVLHQKLNSNGMIFIKQPMQTRAPDRLKKSPERLLVFSCGAGPTLQCWFKYWFYDILAWHFSQSGSTKSCTWISCQIFKKKNTHEWTNGPKRNRAFQFCRLPAVYLSLFLARHRLQHVALFAFSLLRLYGDRCPIFELFLVTRYRVTIVKVISHDISSESNKWKSWNSY